MHCMLLNSAKSVAVRMCPYNTSCKPLELAGDKLKYVEFAKYPGVCLDSSTRFKCSADCVKVEFYHVFTV